MADKRPLPSISIVIPSFNQGRFIREALDSLWAQDYPRLEIIVMDGGSTDGTVEILRECGDRLTFWHSGPDAGQSDAINRGFERAGGEVLNWLCCDDLLMDGALKRVGAWFRDHEDGDWLAGAAENRYLDEGRVSLAAPGVAHRTALREFWLWGAPGHVISQPACFWRRAMWQRAGGLRVDNHLAMDYELWLNFSRLAELHVLDDTLAVSRVHDQCKSGGQRVEQIRQTMRAAYADAARDGQGPAAFTRRVLAGLLRYRGQRLRDHLANHWPGGALREALAMTGDLARVWHEPGRMRALRHMM